MDVRELDTKAQLNEILFNFADQLGFSQSLFTTFPTFSRPESNIDLFVTDYDRTWMEHYSENNYATNDRAVRHCLSNTDSAFIWPGNTNLRHFTPQEKRVYREANECGICHGLTLPISTVPGVVGVVSLAFDGSKEQFQRHYQEYQKTIAQFSYALTDHALKTNYSTHLTASILTPKEKDALCWLAHGLTYDQIATKMNVGTSTVRKHIASVLRKLNAKNSVHASVIAVRWGLI